jgi:hypothetical protein
MLSLGSRSEPVGLSTKDVLRFWPFVAIDNLKRDDFPFQQCLVSLPLNGGVMDENIVTSFLGDEAEALFVVEPFDFPTGHTFTPLLLETRPQNKEGHPLATQPMSQSAFRNIHTSPVGQ